MTTLSELWVDDQGQDIAEYAVMLAAILVIVIGTIRLIGSNANNAFSAVASSAPIEGLCWRLKVFEGSCASVLQNAVWSMHREQSRHFGDERALRSQFRSVSRTPILRSRKVQYCLSRARSNQSRAIVQDESAGGLRSIARRARTRRSNV